MSSKSYVTHAPGTGPMPPLRVLPLNARSNSRKMSARESSLRSTDVFSRTSADVSPWCTSTQKRAFDLLCVTPALVLLGPVLGLIAFAVRLSSEGPIIFRQQRVGQHRRLFTIYKFRTMIENSEAIGPGHTATGDPRITRVGKFLRRFKLDEFPQLYNVLRGDMSLVGPRPKLADHEHTSMPCRPGVTGAATLAFRNEQHILCEVDRTQIESFYRRHVVPLKIYLDAQYMWSATLFSDLRILFATVLQVGDHLTHDDLLMHATGFPDPALPPGQLATELAGD